MPEPYYRDDSVTLYHGDCLEITEWLEADVLVTDPPYGINWCSHGSLPSAKNRTGGLGIANDKDTSTRDAALRAWEGIRPALVFGSLKASYPQNWSRMLVFEKPLTAGLFGNRKPWLTNWEPIFVLGEWPEQTPNRSGVIKTGRRSAGGFRGYVTDAGHSHAKPLDVMEQLVDACPIGVIADPFAGSGSTLLAARNLGRKAIGVELDERYCEIIANRLDQMCLDFGTGM